MSSEKKITTALQIKQSLQLGNLNERITSAEPSFKSRNLMIILSEQYSQSEAVISVFGIKEKR
jgi:hypothetical protein